MKLNITKECRQQVMDDFCSHRGLKYNNTVEYYHIPITALYVDPDTKVEYTIHLRGYHKKLNKYIFNFYNDSIDHVIDPEDIII